MRKMVAAAAVILFALGPARAATKGEFGNNCAMGYAAKMDVPTDCSVSEQIDGKTYCFGDEDARAEFMKDPEANISKAGAYAASKE